MSEKEKLIEKIIFDYDNEMGLAERPYTWAEIFGNHPPSAVENYLRQKRQGPAYDTQREALRRVLSRLLPSEQDFRPAAEQALQAALDGIDRTIK